MIINKTFLAGLVGVSLCMANISGIVTDTGTTPISGAVVQLEKGGQSVTTGADGSFTLVTTAILPNHGKLLPNGLSAVIAGNLMTVTIGERAVVQVATFDLNGKLLSTVRKTLDAGIHTITLPQRGAGVFLYKVKSGNREFVLKGNSVDGASSGSGGTAQLLSSNTPAKQAKAAVAINDVIAATKTGYLNYRCVQYNSDTSGIAIKMIASAGTVKDTDGNVYQTVKIGNQVWMAENLRVTRYRDGEGIPLETSTVTWNSDTTPAYCFYNNRIDSGNIKKYGALYNWAAVDTKKLAPAGWHVPTDSEWEVMQSYLVMHGYNYDGTTDTANNKIAMALAAQTDWYSYTGAGFPGNNMTKNNSSGFSALPGGHRDYDGAFNNQSYYGYWWTATENGPSHACGRTLYCNHANLYSSLNDYYNESHGFSVRLVKD